MESQIEYYNRKIQECLQGYDFSYKNGDIYSAERFNKDLENYRKALYNHLEGK